MQTQWQFYRDNRGKFRWRCKEKKSGQMLGYSIKGFSNTKECRKNARIFGFKGK